MMWLFVRTGYAGGGYDPVLVRGARTKGQYTTAWPVGNLIVSGSAANNNSNGIESLAHPVLRRGV